MSHPTVAAYELKAVNVARTLEIKQKAVPGFLAALGRNVRGGVVVRSIGSTHVTFLESRGVNNFFKRYGYKTSDVDRFAHDMEHFLTRKHGDKNQLKIPVERHEPLRWITKNQLALNLVETDQLLDERADIEQYVRGRFGVLPELTPFNPHVTIGEVKQRSLAHPDFLQDPSSFVTGRMRPDVVVLNGLSVYVGGIHTDRQSDRRPTLPPPQPEID